MVEAGRNVAVGGSVVARAALCGVALAVTGIFFIDLCGALFACGCRSLWLGAAAECNVHEMAGPHCPWCARPVAGAVAFFAVVGGQFAALWVPSGLGLGTRLAIAVAALPVVGGTVGLLQGWLVGYWS